MYPQMQGAFDARFLWSFTRLRQITRVFAFRRAKVQCCIKGHFVGINHDRLRFVLVIGESLIDRISPWLDEQPNKILCHDLKLFTPSNSDFLCSATFYTVKLRPLGSIDRFDPPPVVNWRNQLADLTSDHQLSQSACSWRWIACIGLSPRISHIVFEKEQLLRVSRVNYFKSE